MSTSSRSSGFGAQSAQKPQSLPPLNTGGGGAFTAVNTDAEMLQRREAAADLEHKPSKDLLVSNPNGTVTPDPSPEDGTAARLANSAPTTNGFQQHRHDTPDEDRGHKRKASDEAERHDGPLKNGSRNSFTPPEEGSSVMDMDQDDDDDDDDDDDQNAPNNGNGSDGVRPFGQVGDHVTPNGVRTDGRGNRKRQFSNRTKTGCLTCRRRKKKCDEGKPECQNCMRGGFICDGYSGKINWQKTPNKTQHAIASAGGQSTRVLNVVPAPRPSTGGGSTTVGLSQAHVPQNKIDRVSPPEGGSPTNIRLPNGTPYSAHPPQGLPPPQPVPVDSKYAQSRQIHPSQTTHSHTMPQSSSAATRYPAGQLPPMDYARASTDGYGSRGPSASIAQAPQGPLAPPAENERRIMMDSGLYNHDDAMLVSDRKRCSIAVETFNRLASPSLDTSPSELVRALRNIICPGGMPITRIVSGNHSFKPGDGDGLGTMAKVEAPFSCEYGFNIRLGRDVYIEQGVHIQDAAAVTIKNSVVIGARTMILTVRRQDNPQKRLGTRGKIWALPVLIEDNVLIEPGCIITPGIKIGYGAIVTAGTVVTQNVPPTTRFGGRGGEVTGGLYFPEANTPMG